MPEGQKPEGRKRRPGTFSPGTSGNPGGVPKWRRDIERMLDDEHRTVDQMRETFALIRKVAHGVLKPVFFKGQECGYVMVYDGAWMELYLNRVIGPVKDIKVDLTDAPADVVEWIAENLN